ncbi:MAG TPA: hypothetical protein VM346_02080 [Sphingomicrobium sp.]|jgi:hypothetical protein|nr:hypothetical protein [Sphingomicrobium sp.]
MNNTDLRRVLDVDPAIRYAATNRSGRVEMVERQDISSPSDSGSDRYEELFVNPALICLAESRGNLDCGGLSHIIIRYGNFWQAIIPLDEGHISIAIELHADFPRIVASLLETLPSLGFVPRYPLKG